MRSIFVVIALAVGCSSSSAVGTIRFQSQPPVWRVDDRVPQAKAPKARGFRRFSNKTESAMLRRATRALELRHGKRVLDINSIEEVPDSTWFTNRIGVRDIALDELRRGPDLVDSPFEHRPWTITGGKIGGMSIGFTFEDQKQRKFLLKFDLKEHPETETAAHFITHRILHAIGYNVPDDHIGYIRRGDLVVGDGARKDGIDEAKLDAALKLVHHRDDGAIRVLTSMLIPGTPIGPYPREGVRPDDANDLIPHERRRSIRGQYPIFAWLDHTDVKEDNTLDTFRDGYVVHYLLDFGKSLGVMATGEKDRTVGHRFIYDIPSALGDMLTLGLRVHDWEHRRQPALRGVGMYDTEHYDPGSWRPVMPYWPLHDKDRLDAFWGAKLLMRFKPFELAAIVDEAQLSDPRSSRYLVDTLVKRQRKTARYWFDRVAPLDRFAISAIRDDAAVLCFTDLMLAYRLRLSPATYRVDTFHHDGTATTFATTAPNGRDGQTCVRIPLTTRPDRYTIARFRMRRDNRELPPVTVHVARVPGGRLDIVGLRRR